MVCLFVELVFGVHVEDLTSVNEPEGSTNLVTLVKVSIMTAKRPSQTLLTHWPV